MSHIIIYINIVMELTPCLGLGDLLILKSIAIANDLNITKIHLSIPLMKNYRQYPERFAQFITQFIKMLFPKILVDIVPDTHNRVIYEKYVFKSPYIYDYLRLPTVEIPYKNYITFHTKVRMDYSSTEFMQNELPILEKRFRKFKTGKTIIIMGERVVENCYEQRVLGITSIYSSLLFLKKHNHVTDLTKEILYSGNPDYGDFVYDLNVIRRAGLNVTFGIGGPFGLCHAFSQHNLSYLGVTHNYDYLFSKYQGVHRDLKNFVTELSTYFEKKN